MLLLLESEANPVSYVGHGESSGVSAGGVCGREMESPPVWAASQPPVCLLGQSTGWTGSVS